MEVIHPRVAGIDVHKKIVWVAVRLPGQRPGERTVTVKRFKTFWRSLRQMAAWLAELGVTDAAMESTGVYWWPVYHALAGAGIEVCVCNAAHMRNVPGRKRDVIDCQWIAELHEHGLLRPSFIPAGAVAELRARTRYRKKLIEQRTSEGQRLAKVLEDAGIKIDSVASRLLLKSGRAMIEALIAGERNPGRLADLALGRLRRKIEELQLACDGRFTAARLAAWAGLAPGDNESAGKRKHAAARKGNRHLRTAMVESAWATARTRTRPGARFRRLARRFGKGNEKKAAVAVAHTLICIAWAVLSRGEDYAEAGEDYYQQRDRRDREHLIRHHQQALARLGCQVTLIPPGDGSPPPSATSQQPAA